MSQSTQQDIRELIGFPREVLRKPKRTDRAALKKYLSTEVDPILGVRVSLALGQTPRSDWLTATVLDQALSPEDIAKYLDKLAHPRKLMNVELPLDVLQRRFQPAISRVILSSIRKLVLPSRRSKKTTVAVVLTEDSALAVIRICSSLTSALPGTGSPRTKAADEVVEVVASVVEGCPTPTVAAAAVKFLSVLDKKAGWTVLDRPPVQAAIRVLIGISITIGKEQLLRGRTDILGELVPELASFEAADSQFRAAIAEEVQSKAKLLSLRARNWAHSYLSKRDLDEAQPDSQTKAPMADASRERLALILINCWEARLDGELSRHAFSVTEEVCRIGFNLFLMGEPGAEVEFDPDIHESKFELRRGAASVLVRPWIEWHSPDGIRVLIRGRVSAVTSQ